MIISRSKIKADWKLTVLNADNSVAEIYQFPDNFLNPFFDAVNGFACQPMDDWGSAFIKWGYSNAPLNLDSDLLGQITTLPAKYTTGRWPAIDFSDAQTSPELIDEENGKPVYFAAGFFDYDPVTKLCTKRSGWFNHPTPNSLGNPQDRSFILLDATELTAPLREIGVAYNYNYETYWHLDDPNNPVYTDPRYIDRNIMDRGASPYVSTRALILDQNGDPTEIVLQPGQKLKIERSTHLEFEVPPPITYDIPITETVNGSEPTVTGNRQVTVTMHPPTAPDSFVKNAPPGPLLSVWWPQQMTCYTSGDELIPGWGNNVEWITAGWDPVQQNWGNMAAHDFDISNRYDGDPLDFTTVVNKNIAKVVIHDGGAVDAPAGYQWNLLAKYEFNPPIPLAEGTSQMTLRFGWRLKRHMSPLPQTNLADYSWPASDVIITTQVLGDGVTAYNIGTRRLEPTDFIGYEFEQSPVRYNPTNRTIAVTRFNGAAYAIEFISVDTWTMVDTIALNDPITTFEYNSDYSLLAVGHWGPVGYTVYRTSDWSTLAGLPPINEDSNRGVKSIDWDDTRSDYNLLLGYNPRSGDSGVCFVVTNPANTAGLSVGDFWKYPGTPDTVISARFVKNSTKAVVAYYRGYELPMRVIDLSTKTELANTPVPNVANTQAHSSLNQMDVLPDGSKAIVQIDQTVGNKVHIYDFDTNTWSAEIDLNAITGKQYQGRGRFRVAPNGKYVVWPNNLMLNARTGALIRHPDINTLLAGSDPMCQPEIILKADWETQS